MLYFWSVYGIQVAIFYLVCNIIYKYIYKCFLILFYNLRKEGQQICMILQSAEDNELLSHENTSLQTSLKQATQRLVSIEPWEPFTTDHLEASYLKFSVYWAQGSKNTAPGGPGPRKITAGKLVKHSGCPPGNLVRGNAVLFPRFAIICPEFEVVFYEIYFPVVGCGTSTDVIVPSFCNKWLSWD